MKFNIYAKISQIRCTRDFTSCHGPGYWTKKDIHLNLLRAGLVKDIIELSQSPWSGHSALMGKFKREWQKTDYVLFFFGQNIAALAQQVCQKYNISLGELRSGSRRRDVVETRCSISWIAVRELGYSGADVARYLGVTNSCVTRFIASGQKTDVENLIKKLWTFCTMSPFYTLQSLFSQKSPAYCLSLIRVHKIGSTNKTVLKIEK